MIEPVLPSGLKGWIKRLRDNYTSFAEFESYAATYGLAERLGFDSVEDLWDENPYVHGSVEPSDFGLHEFPDAYLYVYECRSGEEWIRAIRGNGSVDLATNIKKWVKEEFCGEFRLDGEIMPKLEGEYYAKILMDGRPPDSVVCWDSGGFFLKSTYA